MAVDPEQVPIRDLKKILPSQMASTDRFVVNQEAATTTEKAKAIEKSDMDAYISSLGGTPDAHATSHKTGGSDEILLDELGSPTDTTDLNATTSAHGLLPKLSGNANEVLNGEGNYVTPAGGGDVTGPASAVDSNFASFDTTTGKLLKDSGSGPSDLGETNTASNIGSSGIGVVKQKAGVDFELKKITGSSTSGIDTSDSGSDEILVRVTANNMAIQNSPVGADTVMMGKDGSISGDPERALMSNLPISDPAQTALDLKRNTADQIDATDIDVADSLMVLDAPSDLQDIIVQVDTALFNARGTGVTSFDGLSINGGTPANVDIGAGTGELFVPSAQIYKPVVWAASLNTVISNTGVPITHYYVHDDDNDGVGTIVQTTTALTRAQMRSWIYLGDTSFGGGAIIAAVSRPTVLQNNVSTGRDFIEDLTPIHKGVRASPNGANLNLNISAGTISDYSINFDVDLDDPHHYAHPSDTLVSFRPGVQDGSLIALSTTLDVANYNPTGSTISAIGGGPNTSSIFTCYTFADGVTVVLYGQDTYANLTDAEEALSAYAPSVPDFFENAARTTFIVATRTATDLSDPADAAFFYTNKFGLIGGGISAAGAGYLETANNLSDLDSSATALVNLGVTSTAAELNILDGATLTTAELNYVDGVTSAIQTQLNAKASIQRYVDFSLPAGFWGPYTTGGAEATTVVYGSNKQDVFAFDAATEEAIYCQFELPENYNGGVLRWHATVDAAATASGTMVVGLSGGSFGDSDALSTALGTERTVTDTVLTVGDRHKTPNDATGITLAGSPVAGDWVMLKLVFKTSGTVSVDQYFLGLQIQYQTSSTEPSVWT